MRIKALVIVVCLLGAACVRSIPLSNQATPYRASFTPTLVATPTMVHGASGGLPPAAVLPPQFPPFEFTLLLPVAVKPTPLFEFSLDQPSLPVPENIIRQISTSYGTGGPYGGPGAAKPPNPQDDCYDDSSVPHVEYFRRMYQNLEWVDATLCNFPAGDKPSVWVVYPDQTIINIHEGTGAKHLRWLVPPDAPEGSYQFVVNGVGPSISFTTRIQGPMGPKMYYDEVEAVYLLYNFQPLEKVKLLAYLSTGGGVLLVNIQETQVDESGQRKVRLLGTGKDTHVLTVVGEQSGEAEPLWYEPYSVYKCPGGSYQYLRPGRAGRVFIDNLTVYENPDSLSRVVGELHQSDARPFLVTGGPRCVASQAWWPITDSSGMRGWIPETIMRDGEMVPIVGNFGYYEEE